MKRIIVASVIAMAAVAAGAVTTAGTAWGANTPPTAAIITFDDAAQQAVLQIPDPPCDATMPNCVWKFFLNEPKVSVDVATVYGTSGTLVIPYPSNFCQIIQADAYVGPTMDGPWQSKRGWQHKIPDQYCPTPPPPDAPQPVEPPVPPAAPVVVPPTPPATQATAVTPVVAAAAAAPTTTTTTTATTEPKAAAAVTSLPFTGANLRPFVLLGVTLVALGLGLLIRRRKPTL